MVAGILLISRACVADVLVENFDDGNLFAENWGNAQWRAAASEQTNGPGTAVRSTGNNPGNVASSSKKAFLVPNAGGQAFCFSDSINGATGPTLDSRRYQVIGLGMERATNAPDIFPA
jgi:hypothetical protein